MSKSLYGRLARRFAPERLALSRRDVLKASLAAGAASLLSNCGIDAGASGGLAGLGGGRRVIVIGGGFSGMACAYELHSAGYDVIVLEARSRLGGRVLSFKDMVPGKVVEGGGEFIGTNHPTWLAYAKKFGLPLRQAPDDETLWEPIIINGERLAQAEAKKLYDGMSKALDTLNRAATAVNLKEPWNTPGARDLDARTMADWLDALEADERTKRAVRAEWEGNNGVSFEHQSYLAFLTMVQGGGGEKFWTDSEVFRCGPGNQALAMKLAGALGSRVRMRSPVASIVRGGRAVMVTTVDGRRYTAEDVVLTAPPSCWENIHFTPALPAELRPQMGTVVKYLSAVRRRYWKDAHLSADSETDGDVSMTWDATEGQGGDNDGAELTAFSGGPAAEHVRARMPADRHDFYERELEKIYPGYAKNFVASRFMDWPADPFTLAGYSFPAPRQITAIGAVLANGIGNLHFAGEHTSFAFPGYMEGALGSGVATARRLARRDKVV